MDERDVELYLDNMLWDYYYLNAGQRRPANAVVVALVKRKIGTFHNMNYGLWYGRA